MINYFFQLLLRHRPILPAICMGFLFIEEYTVHDCAPLCT